MYHYLKYEYFEKLIDRKKLRFVDPFNAWNEEDNGEMGFLKKLYDNDEEVQKALIEEIKKYTDDVQLYLPYINNKYLKNLRCQCWSYDDGEYMWEKDGHKYDVRIKVDKQYFSKLKKIKCVDVYYINEDDEYLEEVAKKIVSEDGLNLQYLFAIKYKRYEKEKEVRLIIDKEWSESEKESLCQWEYIDISNHIDEVILEVSTSPYTDYEIKSKVYELCDKNGISFRGE